jgi:glutamate racemase
MNNSVEAIGVFGPGSGALTITQALTQILPERRILHFSDVRNAPYGMKDFHDVKKFVQEGIRFLKGKGCSIVILGCNTSSIHAPFLRAEEQDSNFHIVSLIDITLNYYLSQEFAEPLLILGTQATVSSDLYRKQIQEKMPKVAVHQDTLVSLPALIDAGAPPEEIISVIRENLMRIKKEHSLIHTVALCCTHYPLCAPLIESACREVFGTQVHILQQAPALIAWAQAAQLTSQTGHIDNTSGASVELFLNQENPNIRNIAAQLIQGPNGENLRITYLEEL